MATISNTGEMRGSKVAPFNNTDGISDSHEESVSTNSKARKDPRINTNTNPSQKDKPDSLGKPPGNTKKVGIINEAFVKGENKSIPYGSISTGQSSSSSKAVVRTEENNLLVLPDNEQQRQYINGVKEAGNGVKEAVAPPSKGLQVVFRRWFMLAIFCMYSFSSAFQWIHLNIIGNIITEFYNQSLPDGSYEQFVAVDMLSMIYMIMYVPFIFPATWLLDKKGLRICCVIGSIINAMGAWLKCASVSGDRFAVLMTAQTLCALAQNFVLGIPPRLAAVWFGPNEVSTATSIGVFGNQVGVAIGFFLPPMIVKNSGDMSQMAKELSIMNYSTAAYTTIIAILILLFFKNNPPHPPSRAQQLIVEAAAQENYFKSLKNLLTNKGFLILTIAYGVNTGTFYAISTLLNTVVLNYFEGHEEDAGRIGLTLVLTGVGGAILGGLWLDRTKTFKSTTIAIYILSLLGMIAFTFTLDLGHIWIVYVMGGALGFFMTGYLPVGFEFAAEITYPQSEGTSSGLLNCCAQVFGIIFTLSMRVMVESISVLSANITLCACLLAGCLLTAIIKADYRRQEAGREVVQVFVQESEIIVPNVEDQSNDEKNHDGAT